MQQLPILTKQKLFDKIAKLKVNIWRVVRVVEGAALEMLCPERDLGFESLTLRQKKRQFSQEDCRFLFYSLFSVRSSLFSFRLLSKWQSLHHLRWSPSLYTRERHKLLVNFDIQSERSGPHFIFLIPHFTLFVVIFHEKRTLNL